MRKELNKPLKGYKLEEIVLPGYIVYSVGVDGEDNNGETDNGFFDYRDKDFVMAVFNK